MDKPLTPPDATLAMMRSTQGDSVKTLNATKTAKGSIDLQKAEEAAREFEAVFIAEMMKPMFEGLSTEAPFGGGKGEEVFRSMLLQEYGKLVSQTGSIGLADDVKSAMIQMQNEANGISTETQQTTLKNGDEDANSIE